MQLTARSAAMTDAPLLWRWANDAETRRNAFSKGPIPYAGHVAWLGRRLASPATQIWIFSDGDEPVGQVRFDVTDDVAEIDISVAPDRRGRGRAKAMLAEAIRRLRAERGERLRPRAEVLEHNVASLKLFKACGFAETGTIRRGEDRAIVLELPAGSPGEQGR
jgi:RimJ/RimL family protein N-acetyltransferase